MNNNLELFNYRKKLKLSTIKVLISQILIIILFISLWQLLSDYKIINSFLCSSPKNIIDELDLKHLDYSKTTCYGHFGKENLSYEKLNKIEIIKKSML